MFRRTLMQLKAPIHHGGSVKNRVGRFQRKSSVNRNLPAPRESPSPAADAPSAPQIPSDPRGTVAADPAQQMPVASTTPPIAPSAAPRRNDPSSLMHQLYLLQKQYPRPLHNARSQHNPVYVAAVKHMFSTPSSAPLWGKLEGSEVTDESFHTHVGEAGRVLRIAIEGGTDISAARVSDVLEWFRREGRGPNASRGNASGRRPCTLGVLSLFSINIIQLGGSAFVLEHVIPFCSDTLTTLSALQQAGEHEAHPAPHPPPDIAGVVATLQVIRGLCDSALAALETSKDCVLGSPKAHPNGAQTPLSVLRGCVSQAIADTTKQCIMLLSNWDTTSINMHGWNVVVSTLCKLSMVVKKTTQMHPQDDDARISLELLRSWYGVVKDKIVSATSQPSVESTLRATPESIAKTELLAAVKPLDAIRLLGNLEFLFRAGVLEAAEVAQNVMYMLPPIMRRAGAREIIKFLVSLIRWKHQVKIVGDDVLARTVDSCRLCLMHTKLPLHDAVSLLLQLGRLRFPLPLDLVERLTDVCIAQQDSLSMSMCVSLVSSLERIVESDISTAVVTKSQGRELHLMTNDHELKWKTFREGKLDYVLHIVLQRVQSLMEQHEAAAASPNSGSNFADLLPGEEVDVQSTNSGGVSISTQDALSLVTSYAELNNASSSFSMYRLMRPLLSPLFDPANELPPPKVLATLLGALTSLRQSAVTTTFEEEEIVRQAEEEVVLLLRRCVEEPNAKQSLDKAQLSDAIGLLGCVVQSLCDEKSDKRELLHHIPQLTTTTASARERHGASGVDEYGNESNVTASVDEDQQMESSRLASFKELLQMLLSRVETHCEEATGHQIGSLARLCARIHRQHLAPPETYMPLMSTIVSSSVRSFSQVSEKDFSSEEERTVTPAASEEEHGGLVPEEMLEVKSVESDVGLQQRLMNGPRGSIALHDLCSVLPLMALEFDAPMDNAGSNTIEPRVGSASHHHLSLSQVFSMEMAMKDSSVWHIWSVTLRRICLVAHNLPTRDLRVLMHLLVNMGVLKYDLELFAGLGWKSFIALCDAARSVSDSFQLHEVAALVASMHAARAFLSEEDSVEAPDSTQLAQDDEATPVARAQSSAPLSDDKHWHHTFTVLSERATHILKSHNTATNALPLSDVKWGVKILKGLADNLDGPNGDGVHPARVAFFYELLPILMREAPSLSAVDLSLALHAYAKGGIWNVAAMGPLLRSATDGLSIAPVRQCLALLHTVVRSGFVRPELLMLDSDVAEGARQVARGTSEAMEHVVLLLCRRLSRELSGLAAAEHPPRTLGGSGLEQLQEKEVLALVNTLAYFHAPMRPLFDCAMRELRRRVVHRTISENAHFSAALGPIALVAHAPLLRLGQEHVCTVSEVLRNYLSGVAWQQALLRQPVARAVKALELIVASCTIAHPPLTADEFTDVEGIMCEFVMHHWGNNQADHSPSIAWLAQCLGHLEQLHVLSTAVTPALGTGRFEHLILGIVEALEENKTLTALDTAAALRVLALCASTVTDAHKSNVDRAIGKATAVLLQHAQDSEETSHPDVHLVRSVLRLKHAVNCCEEHTAKRSTETLEQQVNALVLWLSRRPNAIKIVWCLRVLSREKSPLFDDAIAALDRLLVDAWSADIRAPEASVLLISVICLDGVVAQRLSALNSHFIRRAPLALRKMRTRASRTGSTSIAPNESLDAALQTVLTSLLSDETIAATQ